MPGPWNWQLTGWPEFLWEPGPLAAAEDRFLVGGGLVIGALDHFDDDRREHLAVRVLSDEAVTTSRIEGETLDRESVQSSVRRRFGLEPDGATAGAAEEGIAEMMVSLYRTSADPLDSATLGRWHEMVARGRRDLRDVGRWRTHAEPMQVVSGRIHDPKVHFEAPASAAVPAEMNAFVSWFNGSAPNGEAPLGAIARSALAHLRFESIHPFEDGNGRVGRAVSEKALAQGVGGPALTSLSATILRHQRAYYDALQSHVRTLQVDGWIRWFAGIALEAQIRTRATVQYTLDATRLRDRVRDQLNARQSKALGRMLAAGPDGFEGGMSAGKYLRLVRASRATATRDLGELVELGVLSRTGERRHTRYHLTIEDRPVPRVSVGEDGRVVEHH